MELAAACTSQSVGPATQLLYLLIQSLSSDQCGLIPNWPIDFGLSVVQNEQFDFIVVGAGSAGSVVASRLSENSRWNVLLLEAGGDPPIESEIPALHLTLQNSLCDWMNLCEPSTTAGLGIKNQTVYWPRAKMLGGCSGHNGMLYARGNERDYQRWFEAGNPTWDWENVLHYFKKSENNGNEKIASNKRYHSTGGPLRINDFGYKSETLNVMELLYSQIGFEHVEDFNAGTYLGYGTMQGTLYEGTRYSTAKDYLIPARNRTNLKVIKNAQVTTLNFHSDKSVAAVNYHLNGVEYKVSAKKEVILSAGVVNTPTILLNSGIGPAQHLKEMNIGVLSNIAVGHNLQDHVITLVPIIFKNLPAQIQPADSYYDYLTTKTGQYSNVGMLELVSFYSTTGNPKYPDIQFMSLGFNVQDSGLPFFLGKVNFNDDIINSFVSANRNAPLVIVLVTVLNPKSRGVVELKSKDPLKNPKIIPNYLSQQHDVQNIIGGIRKLQMFNTTETFAEAGVEFVRIPLPDCDRLTYDSDSYWECYARYISSSVYHPVGSCKMGPITDKASVVDSQLKVRGVKGVRIIDASIMPTTISGNTNAPTIMIAEKGSDMIKDDWLLENFI